MQNYPKETKKQNRQITKNNMKASFVIILCPIQSGGPI